MNDMMEVFDQAGNRVRVTRKEYITQVMNAARQNWNEINFFRQVTPQVLSGGFVDEALELANRACEISGGHIPDLYWRAAALAESGRLEEAAAAFEEVREDAAYPADQARAAMGLARTYGQMGKEKETVDMLTWAVKTDADNPQYLITLYNYYNDHNRADDGLTAVKNLGAQIDNKATGYRALLQIVGSRNEVDEIKKYTQEALAVADERDKQNVLAEASWLYGQAGQAEEIVSLLAPQIQDVKHPLALMNLAQAYVDTNRKENAVKLLEAVLVSAPEDMKPMVSAKLNELRESQDLPNPPQA